jgi:hypothetical protein
MKIGSLVKPSNHVGQKSGGIYLYINKEIDLEHADKMFLFKHSDVGIVLENSYIIEVYEDDEGDKNKVIDVIKILTKKGIGWATGNYVYKIR